MLRVGRLASFSDGVIAIIITIMVLEIRVPAQMIDHSIWHGILEPIAPKLIAYVLSFIVVAIMWANHYELLRTARYASASLIWANAHLLFWMSLIPVTTHLLGQGLQLPNHVAIHGFVLFASASGFVLLRQLISLQRERTDDFTRRHCKVLWSSSIGTALYAAAIPLAYISVRISLAIYLIVPAMFFLPPRMQRHAVSASASRPNSTDENPSGLVTALKRLVEPVTRGDPVR